MAKRSGTSAVIKAARQRIEARQRKLDALKGLLVVYLKLLDIRHMNVRPGSYHLIPLGPDFPTDPVTPEQWATETTRAWDARIAANGRALVANRFRGGRPPMT